MAISFLPSNEFGPRPEGATALASDFEGRCHLGQFQAGPLDVAGLSPEVGALCCCGRDRSFWWRGSSSGARLFAQTGSSSMATPVTAHREVRFGEFALDLQTAELRHNDRKLTLQEQPFQVLAVLLEHAGQLVTRDELKQRLWPSDTFGDFDHGLNKAVNRLREVLGDSAENPRFVETVPRRGYRFIAPTKERDDLRGGRCADESAEPRRAATGKFRIFLVPGVVLVIALGGVLAWFI